jgi:hypothetical protein
LVRRSGFGLRPLDRSPCRLHRVRFPTHDRPVRSPHELSPLPRSLSRLSARPARRSLQEGSSLVLAPLLRSLAPSALKDRSVHDSRLCLSRCVPTSPFLTTSPVCSAMNPSRDLPGWHSWGLLPCRVSPDSPRSPPSPASSPLMVFSRRLSPSRALRPKPPLAASMHLQGVSPASRPYPSASGFPSAGD